MHFHWRKQEDIINRGGGNLIVELWNSDAFEQTEKSDVTVTLDGCRQTHAAGSQLRLSPGESICLVPGVYHSFWGEVGYGEVLVGEVSMVNDDDHDNRFMKPLERFNSIIEDEPAELVLCNGTAVSSEFANTRRTTMALISLANGLAHARKTVTHCAFNVLDSHFCAPCLPLQNRNDRRLSSILLKSILSTFR